MHRSLSALLLLLVGCADDAGSAPASALPEHGDGTESSAASSGNANGPAVDPDAPCPTSFTKDVMPKLVATCGSASCHLDATRPSIEPTTPQLAYEDLLDFGFDDASWVDPHPDRSNATNADLVTVVDGWRACGAPFE